VCPDRLWGPHWLLYKGYRGSFPGCKSAAGAWRWPFTPHLGPRSRMSKSYTSSPSSASMACSGPDLPFTFNTCVQGHPRSRNSTFADPPILNTALRAKRTLRGPGMFHTATLYFSWPLTSLLSLCFCSVAQEPEGSSPHSQQPATGPCPETVESNPHKGKAVLATRHGGAWGRGGIAPTHSRPQHSASRHYTAWANPASLQDSKAFCNW
jgi:hypothetical protein